MTNHIYDPKSLNADEFINHNEILDTLIYAEAHKNDTALIGSLLEKARPTFTAHGCTCSGLTHREASVLLACEDPEILKRIYDVAAEIKQAFYGN